MTSRGSFKRIPHKRIRYPPTLCPVSLRVGTLGRQDLFGLFLVLLRPRPFSIFFLLTTCLLLLLFDCRRFMGKEAHRHRSRLGGCCHREGGGGGACLHSTRHEGGIRAGGGSKSLGNRVELQAPSQTYGGAICPIVPPQIQIPMRGGRTW